MKGIILVFSLVISSFASAGSNQSSGTTYVKVLFGYETYFVVEVTDAVLPNPAGCTSSRASTRIKMNRNSETDHTYSTFLAAKISGSPVTLGVLGSKCYTWGEGSIPVMYRVDLR